MHGPLQDGLPEEILNLLSARRGHFLLESGHHGDLWLNLESLCLRPRLAHVVSTKLADSLSKLDIDLVCALLLKAPW